LSYWIVSPEGFEHRVEVVAGQTYGHENIPRQVVVGLLKFGRFEGWTLTKLDGKQLSTGVNK